MQTKTAMATVLLLVGVIMFFLPPLFSYLNRGDLDAGTLEAKPVEKKVKEDVAGWEKVEGGTVEDTYRLRVPGGWLYRVDRWRPMRGGATVALAFVPDQAAERTGPP